MKISIIAFTENGGCLAVKLKKALKHDCKGYIFSKFRQDDLEPFDKLSEITEELFKTNGALIFIGACGIAVRAVAPYIKDKSKDPAVVVVDEKGNFAIPVLSGHIGGANELAAEIAETIGAAPIITTATDINDKFSVDTFAVKNNLYITDMQIAKLISSEILRGHKIGLYSDFAYKNPFEELTNDAEIGICISHDERKKPFKTTLNLIPKNIVIGIGCKRGTQNIKEAVEEVLSEYGISKNAVCMIASIDVKKDEAAINSLAKEWNIPFKTYTADELSNQNGDFSVSEFVKKPLGLIMSVKEA